MKIETFLTRIGFRSKIEQYREKYFGEKIGKKQGFVENDVSLVYGRKAERHAKNSRWNF